MSYQTRSDLEFTIWRQQKEIERLKAENAWARKSIALVIEKDNAVVSENKMLKQEIEDFEKAKNADVPLANYADVFTKSELWHSQHTKNERLLDIIFKREPDKTVRVPISDAVVYVVEELTDEHGRTL
ncbi:hypothetical protein [Pseudolactococcus reticulitermitis]|uniref:Uncharacterized protein n=1 Tax=Pseudolactococcus reticulitermitis TaxID=2025039 RepID=A0A224XCC3_9LACT|nr:hypothetical protein [Lactococcus reticulitermitis]GAX47283.1 hypothetical protein RsY01_882 [Lactococcus reticulitermitis]